MLAVTPIRKMNNRLRLFYCHIRRLGRTSFGRGRASAGPERYQKGGHAVAFQVHSGVVLGGCRWLNPTDQLSL